MKENEQTTLLKKMDELIEVVKQTRMPGTKVLLIRSFFQGIFIGLGSTVGFAIVIGLITYAISQLQGVPILDYLIEQSKVQDVLPNE